MFEEKHLIKILLFKCKTEVAIITSPSNFALTPYLMEKLGSSKNILNSV